MTDPARRVAGASPIRFHSWRRQRPRLRLLCLPAAGGGLFAYQRWPQELPDEVEVCTVQLPGREDRVREPALRSAREIATLVADGLGPYLDRPMALYGHSMGAILAFELTRELRRRGRASPVHLLVSSRQAPDAAQRSPVLHGLPDAELVRHLRILDGTPGHVLDDEEVLGMLLPGLRADLSVNETYEFREEPALDVPITAFGGRWDPRVAEDELAGWGRHTRAGFRLRMLPGGHFFVVSELPRLAREVVAALSEGSHGL